MVPNSEAYGTLQTFSGVSYNSFDLQRNTKSNYRSNI